MEELMVLELFSGIGGMHLATQRSEISAKIVGAMDINENANLTYKHNFPNSKCLNNNIQKLRIKDFQNVNCILMSPPCQPFTRNGNFNDVDDRRCDAFQTVCAIIKDGHLPQLRYVLMENVMGFENSQMRDVFVEALKAAGFNFQEFILTPTQVGVANTRHRYYCIARKTQEFSFGSTDILRSLPLMSASTIPEISTYIDEIANYEEHLLPDKILEKRFQVLDICTTDSVNSMCFTKSYSRYIEGTGSVFAPMRREELSQKIAEIEEAGDDIALKKALNLRFFTSSEVARLMSFPSNFTFPESVNEKQRYKLLGNSINVAVVSELIKLLIQI